MIQRLQSIYILLAIVALALMYGFNIATYDAEGGWGGISTNVNGIDVYFADDIKARIYADFEKRHGQKIEDLDPVTRQEVDQQVDRVINAQKALIEGISKMKAHKKFGPLFKVGTYGTALLIVYLVVMLLLYKRRPLQLAMGWIMFFVLILIFLGMIFVVDFAGTYVVDQYSEEIKRAFRMDAPEIKTNYGVALFLPVVAAAFVLLASLRIRKDEKLVKSLDRLR